MAAEFSVTFWGVRGSIACPGPAFQRYGGNTSCLELRSDGHLLIFDAGTGLRPLGERLKGSGPLEIDLFLTHTHLDHIVGIPFFKPLFDAANRVTFWAGHLLPERKLREALCSMMEPPLFPVPIEVFAARTDYRDFAAGETLHPKPGVTLRTIRLNHPNGAIGYRIETGGRSICYITDTEHVPGQLDAGILSLIRGTDILIYDSTYTEAEYPKFKGWGHSTWREGLRLAEAAGAKTFVAFHHDPSHTDEFLDRMAEELAAARPGSLVACEGMTLNP